MLPKTTFMTYNNERAEKVERESALETISQVIKANHGMAKTSALTEAGISYKRILALVEKGDLIRIKSGYYVMPDSDYSEEEMILSQFPDGVLTMQSALFLYGYIEDRPAKWTIAISKNTSKSRFKLQKPPVQPYYTEENVLGDGVTIVPFFEGNPIKIYTKDRLICDVIKYRDRLDRATFQQVLRAYLADDDKDARALMKYAESRRVSHLVHNILGMWMPLPAAKEQPRKQAPIPPIEKPSQKQEAIPPAKEHPWKQEPIPPVEKQPRKQEPIPAVEEHPQEQASIPAGIEALSADPAEVAGCIFVILRQMELIEDMGVFFRLYNICVRRSADGMEVSRRLLELCEEEEFVPARPRVDKLQSWATDRFMEQKWEKYTRRNNIDTVSWMELMAKLASFIMPIGQSISAGQPFIGDWMPQLGRFL